MKLQEVDVDGFKCKVQEGISFVQKQEFIQLLESFIEMDKFKDLSDKDKENMKIGDALKKGVSQSKMLFELTKFVLFNFVKEPTITIKNLEDPDDSNNLNYQVLANKLLELTMKAIAKTEVIKKTPSL
jgi:hypothetical protein